MGGHDLLLRNSTKDAAKSQTTHASSWVVKELSNLFAGLGHDPQLAGTHMAIAM
jgi:hypothetical protein